MKNTFDETEKIILESIANGSTNSEIAKNLNLSESSIKIHINRIMKKTYRKNRVELAVFAIEKNIIQKSE